MRPAARADSPPSIVIPAPREHTDAHVRAGRDLGTDGSLHRRRVRADHVDPQLGRDGRPLLRADRGRRRGAISTIASSTPPARLRGHRARARQSASV